MKRLGCIFLNYNHIIIRINILDMIPPDGPRAMFAPRFPVISTDYIDSRYYYNDRPVNAARQSNYQPKTDWLTRVSITSNNTNIAL